MGENMFSSDREFGSSSKNMRTLVLVGKTGSGKSSTGNSILGEKIFNTLRGAAGVTTTCEKQRCVLEGGHTLDVIDTPGLFDFSAGVEVIGKEIVKCITMAKNGIHAILVVLSVRTRFSREEEAVVERLRSFFGSKISDYMIVVFTGGDDLEENNETLDDYLGRDCPQPLKEVLKMCGNRRVLFDNKTKDEQKKSKQLKKLLTLMDVVVENNDGVPYSDELFLEMQKDPSKLRDETAEVTSSKGYSEQEMAEFQDKLLKSAEEQLKKMVESKLKETIYRLEQQLAQARLNAEKISEDLLTMQRDAAVTNMSSQLLSSCQLLSTLCTIL